jgi:hypothetical protein
MEGDAIQADIANTISRKVIACVGYDANFVKPLLYALSTPYRSL